MEAVVCHSFTLCHVLSFMTYRSHRRFLVFHCCCHCNCSMTLLYIPLSLRSASTLHTCPACTQLFGCSASPNILNSAGLSLRWCCSRQCCLVLLFTCLCYVWLSPDCECFSSFLFSLIRAGEHTSLAFVMVAVVVFLSLLVVFPCSWPYIDDFSCPVIARCVDDAHLPWTRSPTFRLHLTNERLPTTQLLLHCKSTGELKSVASTRLESMDIPICGFADRLELYRLTLLWSECGRRWPASCVVLQRNAKGGEVM